MVKSEKALREITTHKVNGFNEILKVVVVDDSDLRGANHEYQVIDTSPQNPDKIISRIDFQKGGIVEKGVNGVTNEIILAIVMDRLQCFQNGTHSCPENADALHHLKCALDSLNVRTRDRIARGVEGTSKV